jgi:hypothetical protein
MSQHIFLDRNTNTKRFYSQQKLEFTLGYKHDIHIYIYIILINKNMSVRHH